MFDEIESDYVIEGEAEDGEAIIRIRRQIEDHVRETIMDFDHTDLYWNLKEQELAEGERAKGDGVFVYQLHFFKQPKKI